MTSVLAIAETDSYAAWADGLLHTVPVDWSVDRSIVRFPTNPSGRQLRRLLGPAGADRWQVRSRADLRRRLATRQDRIVLVACRGEMAEMIADDVRRMNPDALVVNGVPGLARPMSSRAIAARRDVDVFVVHSVAERRDLGERFRAAGGRTSVGLATLPAISAAMPAAGGASAGHLRATPGVIDPRRIGFVDQEVIPRTRWDRVRLVQLLDATAGDTVTISRRTIPGEESTHRPVDRLDDLVAAMEHDGVIRRDRFAIDDRCVRDFFVDVDVVLTVSSTVGLEAIAAGCPVGFVGDFGVSGQLRNETFVGSGAQVLLRDLDEHVEIAPIDPTWAADNYFHPPERNDWIDIVRTCTAGRSTRAHRSSVRIRTRLAATFPRAAAEAATVINRGGRT